MNRAGLSIFQNTDFIFVARAVDRSEDLMQANQPSIVSRSVNKICCHRLYST
jgi:hypothetical protein